MIMTNTKNAGDLVRIDKNIANNSEAFEIDFQGSEELASSLLMYMAWQRKNKLFDFGIIDPEDFANKMGFMPRYLTSVHPHPACLEGLSAAEVAEKYKLQAENPENPLYRIFDSRFENALYLLVSKNFTFKRVGTIFQNTGNNSMQKLQVTSIRLLKSFGIIFNKSKRGKKKLYYEFQLDDEFSQNLSLLYVTANINDFAALRKKSLHKLYLYTRNLRENAVAFYLQSMKENARRSEIVPNYTADFDLLCRIGGISSTNARDKKRRLKDAFEILKEYLPIHLDWGKRPGEKWAYQPIIVFEELEANSELMRSDGRLSPIEEKVEIFTQNFFLQIITEYKETIGYQLSAKLDNAILDLKVMNFLKSMPITKVKEFYMTAQLQTFSRINYVGINNCEVFCANLASLRCYSDVKKLVAELFTRHKEKLFEHTLESLHNTYKEVIEITAGKFGDPEFVKTGEKNGYTFHRCVGSYYMCK